MKLCNPTSIYIVNLDVCIEKSLRNTVRNYNNGNNNGHCLNKWIELYSSKQYFQELFPKSLIRDERKTFEE